MYDIRFDLKTNSCSSNRSDQSSTSCDDFTIIIVVVIVVQSFADTFKITDSINTLDKYYSIYKNKLINHQS